jgi:hypothetical protein
VRRALVAAALVLATAADCSGAGVRLGTIDYITHGDADGQYLAFLTLDNGEQVTMPGFRSWRCYQGGTLWQAPNGTLYCK